MRPAFGGHPVAETIFLLSLGAWFLLEIRQALNRRPGATSRDRGSLLVLRLFVTAGILLAALGLRVTATGFPYSPVLIALSLAAVWA